MKISALRFLSFALLILASLMAFEGQMRAQDYENLYSFCPVAGCADGENPFQGLVQDPAGNLYGTAENGGIGLGGTVFMLAPPAISGGAWTETTLYTFCSTKNCDDGKTPYGIPVRDAAGNLYGTTSAGGEIGDGTVFKLAPPAHAGGAWTETVLYHFCLHGGTTCTDGSTPTIGLLQDAKGNLYGTTSKGGSTGSGAVFKLAPPAQPGSPWTETVLYSFCQFNSCVDGEEPFGGLIQDTAANLYGTTAEGGAYDDGTVFKLAPPALAGGNWTETVLYSFCSIGGGCTDGSIPYYERLILDASGNLYGTTSLGGAFTKGTVFRLAPPAQLGNPWTETVLYNFCPAAGCTDGQGPDAGVIQDVAGNLYGTTGGGGGSNSGVIFKLTPTLGGGTWTETVLYSLCPLPGCPDGSVLFGGVIQDAAGNLYGATASGGANTFGALFELVSGVHKPFTALGQQVDYFGEGKADFTVRRPSNGTFYSLDSSGKELTRVWGASTDVPVIGDYDGDGKTDFAVWRPSTGVWYISQSRSGQTLEKTFGAPTDKPVPGDYDGDGRTDIAVWRPSTGLWYIIYSSTGAVVERNWGDPDDKPVPGDYDGDGKTDIAVWRPSTGVWFIIQSSNSQIVEKTWGVPTDKPVPGDYDGDGKTDITVWRPSTGVWYIIRSSNGETTEQTLGTTGDIPVSRDYDGDGRTDVAVWRPSKGTWYVNQTRTGKLLEKAWGLSTDIPMNKPIGQ